MRWIEKPNSLAVEPGAGLVRSSRVSLDHVILVSATRVKTLPLLWRLIGGFSILFACAYGV